MKAIFTTALLTLAVTRGAWVEGAETDGALKPPVPTEAWADEERRAALVSVPRREEFARQARTLFKEGWDPYFGFPQIRIMGDRVIDYDGKTRAWRTSPAAAFLTGAPQWRSIFSLGTLDEAGATPFSPRPWNNADCLEGEAPRCLVAITRGGFDEIRWLEVDGATRSVPTNAFDLPASRSWVAWLGPDRVLVASAAGGGRLGSTGYPVQARLWTRGGKPESAPVLYEAEPGTDFVRVESFWAPGGRIGTIQAFRDGSLTKLLVVERDAARDLGLPSGSAPQGVLGGRLIVLLSQAWQSKAGNFPAGSIVAVPIGSKGAPELVFAPGASEAIEDAGSSLSAAVSANGVYFAVLTAGRRNVYRATLRDRLWRIEPIGARPQHVAKLLAVDPMGSIALGSAESMMSPPRMVRLDKAGQDISASPARFDASKLRIQRLEAKGSDGVRIPYWLVGPRDQSGPQPTIIHAYGASNVPTLPDYRADVGRLWLAKGGSFVIAQVRGGGEYGRGWHLAGSGTNRARPVGDLVSVADDLVARGLTDRTHLGIDGQSDGGRLVVAAAMRRPGLFAAVVSRDGAVFPEASVGLPGSPVGAADMRLLETAAGRAIADAYWPSRLFDKRAACPHLLLTSWRGDQRVPAVESRALTALLRSASCAPLLYERAGGEHSTVDADMLGVVYGFFAERLGLPSSE